MFQDKVRGHGDDDAPEQDYQRKTSDLQREPEIELVLHAFPCLSLYRLAGRAHT